jgi:hypothetical protein
LLLGAEMEKRFQEEIEKLAVEHNRQIEALRRSGNRTALWTFAGVAIQLGDVAAGEADVILIGVSS